MDKKSFLEKYQKLKDLNNGQKPLYQDFLKFCGVHKRKLDEVFGGNAYSKLQEECGDTPNRLILKRTPINQVLEQYGELVRNINSLPSIAHWIQAQLKPSIEGFCKVYKIKWSDIPNEFMKKYAETPEWKDVVQIIKKEKGIVKINRANKQFDKIVEKILNWIPDRKRIVEEGYKIELRSYLEKEFNLEEEVGESIPDLLVDKKFPIELKKDPSQSEYDRLLGQMIRHNKLYGSAIAVVTSISSEDRYKKFYKLFTEVHEKLGMTAELIKK